MDADAAVALRRGAFVPADLGLPDRRARSAVLDALERDARPLARYLEHHALARTGQIALGVAPRLRTGQAALADALLWSSLRVSPWPGDWSLIGTILQRALLRRQVLRLLGRDDLAAPDAAIVARVVEVFADRDKVLALAFWSAR